MVTLPRLGLVIGSLALFYSGSWAKSSAGCGKSHQYLGETKEREFESQGRTRQYLIRLPSNYDVNKPLPLMIAYHGRGRDPWDFEGDTRFSDESVNPDMIVVYPRGVGLTWQGPTYDHDVNDKAFTTDLVNRIKDNYCVDTARVYATGHSNGGGFCGTLACSPSAAGQFAAYAPISGAFYTDVHGDDSCHPQRVPLPMMEVHGGQDTTIPYNPTEDGAGGPLPSIPDWLSRWARRNMCDSNTTTDLADGIHRTTWHCDGIDGLLEHVKYDNLAHNWPDASSGLDITPKIIEFLRKNYIFGE